MNTLEIANPSWKIAPRRAALALLLGALGVACARSSADPRITPVDTEELRTSSEHACAVTAASLASLSVVEMSSPSERERGVDEPAETTASVGAAPSTASSPEPVATDGTVMAAPKTDPYGTTPSGAKGKSAPTVLPVPRSATEMERRERFERTTPPPFSSPPYGRAPSPVSPIAPAETAR